MKDMDDIDFYYFVGRHPDDGRWVMKMVFTDDPTHDPFFLVHNPEFNWHRLTDIWAD